MWKKYRFKFLKTMKLKLIYQFIREADNLPWSLKEPTIPTDSC
jgi:hypothetical protein